MIKKLLMVTASIFVLVGCTKIEVRTDSTITEKDSSEIMNKNNKSEAGNEGLRLQLTSEMEQLGQNKDNNQLVRELDELVNSNPDLGTPNDFTIYYTSVSVKKTDSDDYQMIFIGVNKIGRKISDATFKLSIDISGDILFDELPISLPVKTFGVIENNRAFPIFISVPKEKVQILNQIKSDNYKLSITNFEVKK